MSLCNTASDLGCEATAPSDMGGDVFASDVCSARASSGSADDLFDSDADSDALDTVVDGLRLLIAQDATHTTIDHVHAASLSASLSAWLETLFARVHVCELAHMQPSRRNESDAQRETKRNGASDTDADAIAKLDDVADVFAMLLSASARNQWRQRLRIAACNDPFADLLFRPERMLSLLGFLAKLTSPPLVTYTHCESVVLVCDVTHSLSRLALTDVEVDVVLDAWRTTNLLRIENAPDWRTVYADVQSDGQRLGICYARFVADHVVSTSARPQQDDSVSPPLPSVLESLVGADVVVWRQHKWEQAWHLVDASRFCARSFGSSSNCEAMVKRILRGLTVPQIDADATQSLALASFLCSLDLEALDGLRHRVDVTLVRDGDVHPMWQHGERLQLDDVLDAFAHGYTVGIRGVHARSQPIANVCSALQHELEQHVNANIYWTPPGEQGFKLHIDDHCVFVVQLKGKKHWRLKRHVGALPSLYSALSEPQDDDAGPTDEFVLEPGNVLYIPRGMPHCADTHGLTDDSIHITIGVEVEEQFTKHALVLELLAPQLHDSDGMSADLEADASQLETRLESIRAVMATVALQSQLQGGLMAWHLEDVNALRNEITLLLTDGLYNALSSADSMDRDALDAEQRLVQAT